MEEFLELTGREDCPQALAKLEAAYRILGVEPPPAEPEDLPNRLHPVLFAMDRPDETAEIGAWHRLLREETGL